jgi:cytochrome bd-type quinol oxidase subunit 1
MRVSLGSVLTGTAIVFFIVIAFLVGTSRKNNILEQSTVKAATVEANSTSQPCSKPPETYLIKAHSYLEEIDKCSTWQCAMPAMASAYMQYYQICSERQQAQADKRITTDERP